LHVTTEPDDGGLSQDVRILIVSEAPLHGEGLALRLSTEPDIRVVGHVDSIRAALPTAGAGLTDIVLIDLSPTPDNLDQLSTATDTGLGAQFVALEDVAGDGDVVGWIESGVAGVVDRCGSAQELRSVLSSVSRGELLCSPSVARALRDRLRALARDGRQPGVPERLTRREREVLSLMNRGLSNKAMASELGLQLPTVKNHVRNIFDKMGVHSRAEAIARTLSPLDRP
jgi:DNA-binding NarL/FixJ family response regulator